jgi:2',3'-cyclic-nucleotide 2'-phosphodiesterase/3'-nucleotidase
LLLEAGDAFGRSTKREEEKAELILEAMARMGYDAYNLGARELIFGQEFIRNRLDKHGIPLLCSNVMLEEEGTPFALPYTVKDLKGIRVGVVGLMSNLFRPRARRPADRPLSVRDYLQVASRLIPELRKQCQVVLVLGHLTLEEAGELAESIPGITAIILAWAMGPIDPPLEHRGTLILSAGTEGTHLGELFLHLDREGKVVSHYARLTALTRKIPDHPGIAQLLAERGFDLPSVETPLPVEGSLPRI